MPITPFHLGPGWLLTVGTGASFTAFFVANVVIDVESGYHIVTDQYPIHTFLHTFVGATLVAVATAAALCAIKRKTYAAIAGGAFAGAWSHVVLDAVMHGDARPFAPWSDANPLHRVIGLAALHLACVACAVIAGAIVMAAAARRRRSPPSA